VHVYGCVICVRALCVLVLCMPVLCVCVWLSELLCARFCVCVCVCLCFSLFVCVSGPVVFRCVRLFFGFTVLRVRVCVCLCGSVVCAFVCMHMDSRNSVCV